MDYIAKGFYRELLDEQWERGFIPGDVATLAEICECPVKVMQKAWPSIAPCFPANDGGMLVNPKMEAQRTEKDAHRVKQANAGRSGAFAKASLANAGKSQTDSSKSHIAEQSREEAEQKQEQSKSSRGKREPDPRHVRFREEVEAYANAKKVLFTWDGSAAKQLDLLLKACPDLRLELFQQCLLHRARSPGVTHGEHPRAWLPHILKYQEAPLNEFGKTGAVNGRFEPGFSKPTEEPPETPIEDINAMRKRMGLAPL